MTIHDIKRLSQTDSPHFFDRATLRFFGQTMKDFRVKRQYDGRYRISAPIRHDGQIIGETVRYFNSATGTLDSQ